MAYRILVVEDEPDTRELLDFTLRWSGHDVDPVEGGREALEMLGDRSYDVILTNLHMPGMSGQHLYRRIEHGWPHLAPRVVFVTAAPPDNMVRAEHGGRPVPVLTKPYTPERLLQMIEDVVAGRLLGKNPKQWLLEIAIALENWLAMRSDSVEAEMAVTTAGGAVDYLVRALPAEDREAVRGALPVLLPADFAEAAGRIRLAATPLPT